ncbi:MAG TPA: hypothetical protein VKM93_26335 [Terriglobia bacterium]|nr:hypothetical protein [Terriglobia bacterium]
METPTETKPKRKYVMTPEHRAKVVANLAKARLAPKEKVYRKTPRRYAANIGNLAKANAKVREQSESLRAKLEGVFPAPDVPPPPIIPPFGPPLPGMPRTRPAFVPPSTGAEVLDEVRPLIAKRLRKVHAASRREGRRIMRLLMAAIARSQPLGANEAFNLALQLLQCLEGSRVVAEARRLNDKIAHLLSKMIETRYGAEAQVDGFPLATAMEQLRETRRQRAAARRADREARGQQPSAGESSAAPAEGNAAGAAEGEGEGGKADPEGSGGQPDKPSRTSIPVLPKTLKEFRGLVARALDLESEDAASIVDRLAQAIWERLQWWKWREDTEAQGLERLFQEGAAVAPGSNEDLLNRTFDINFVLKLDDDFLHRMDQVTEKVAEALRWWLTQRPLIGFRPRTAGPAAKPPIRATPDEPTGDFGDPSEAA